MSHRLFVLLAAGLLVTFAGGTAYAVAPIPTHVSGDTLSVPTDVGTVTSWAACDELHVTAPPEDACSNLHVDSVGGGLASAGDYLELDGVWYRIASLNPGFNMSKVDTPAVTMLAVPDTIMDTDPSCHVVHEIRPTRCAFHHVVYWGDRGPPDHLVNAGDTLVIGSERWLIDAITEDIVLTPAVPSTSRVGTIFLIVLLALTGLLMVVRARRRGVRTAS